MSMMPTPPPRQDILLWLRRHIVHPESYRSDYFQFRLSQVWKSRHRPDAMTWEVIGAKSEGFEVCKGGGHPNGGVSAHL